jgi:hypothetical protein
MRHIDEGILHAYLDGAIDALAGTGALPASVTQAGVEAHVAACPDCRALLDAARAGRAGADAILRDAGVATIDVPPFEFVARGRVPAAPRRRAALPLAWAASVMLALGAGWWGSETWRMDRAASAAADTDAAQAAPAAARAEAAITVPTEPAVAQADATTAASAPPPAERRAPVSVPDGGSAFAAAGSAGRSEAAADTGAAAEALLPQRLPARVAAGLALPARLPIGEPVQRFALSAPPDEVVVTGAVRAQAPPPPAALSLQAAPSLPPAVRTAAQAGGVARLVPPPGADRMTGAVSAEQPRRDGAAGLRRPLPVDVFREAALAARTGGLSWTPLRLAEAHAAGLPLLMLAGAGEPVLSEAGLDDGDRLIRTVQTLPDGVAVELLVWREPDAAAGGVPAGRGLAGVAPAAVTTLVVSGGESPDGGRELLLRVPSLGAFVMMSGPLEPRRLLDLADALVFVR